MCFDSPKIPKDRILHGPATKTGRKTVFVKGLLIAIIFVAGLVVIKKTEASVGLAEFEAGAESGQMFMRAGGGYVAAMHLGSEADIEISGMLARVSLVQRFRNGSDRWAEGVYVFPLPEKSAVNYMRMKTGDRVITGEIKERQAAQKIYHQARAAGKKAALTEQERPNLFTQSVANIAPGEEVEVTLRFLQPITYDAGEFSLRFPMTLTPRYMPGQPLEPPSIYTVATGGSGWAVPTDQVPDAERVSPFMLPAGDGDSPVNPMRLSVTLNAGLPLAAIDSLYHRIAVSKEQGVHRVKLADETVSMDRDFVLNWRPAIGQSPAAALFTETLNGDNYVSLMLLPPRKQSAQAPLPRELIFIIDTSGSMGGVSIRQAKKSLALALSRLGPEDRFNVIEFNSTHRRLFPQPLAASAANVEQAQAFVGRLDAGGGTEMAPALIEALSGRAPEEYLKQVVFITDGSVGNESALFSLIHQNLGAARLFTVGIGSAPNSYFMRKAAQFGRGTYTFIGSQRETAEKMNDLFRKLESPVLGNIEIRWPDGAAVEMWPRRLPDLYSGEPVLLTAKIQYSDGSGQLGGSAVIEGRVSGETWRRELELDSDADRNGIATLWAREKIAALMDQKIAGRDPRLVREEVLNVALTHRLMSPYTSFVAVERTLSRAAGETLHTEPVPNVVPRGQTANPVMYPRTATSAWLNLVIGGLCLLLVLAISAVNARRESV